MTAIVLKDGKKMNVDRMRDIIDIVRDYVGSDCAELLDSYVDNVQDCLNFLQFTVNDIIQETEDLDYSVEHELNHLHNMIGEYVQEVELV